MLLFSILLLRVVIISQPGLVGGNDPLNTVVKPATKDFFPSFQQLNCADQDSCQSICPANCMSCSNTATCDQCSFGYFLLNNSCHSCPYDCQNCTLESNFSSNLFCSSNRVAYYFNERNLSLMSCSSDCKKCVSSTECLECDGENMFLQFNNFKNFTCQNCSMFYNCKTCIFNNKSNVIGYKDYEKINSLSEFNEVSSLYQWDINCLSCVNKHQYIRKEDSKCYSCSDLIKDCLNCSYGNNTIPDISSNYSNILPFLDLSEYNMSYHMRCYDCGNYKYPKIVTTITTCEYCNLSITNCLRCTYGYLNSSSSLLLTYDFYNSVFSTYSNYSLRCISCDFGYGLKNSNQSSCSECPSNCESCYLNTTTLNMFCGRCRDYFVLSIYEGVCYRNTSYLTQLSYYKGKCLKIVTENPWFANLTSGSNYLCQKCINLNPSLSGDCVSCTNSSCLSCIETSSYLTNTDFVNYTDLLYNNPLSLIDHIMATSSYSSFQRCLSCSNPNYGYNNDYQFCCAPSSFFFSPKEILIIIRNCQKCSACGIISSGISCTICSNCNDVSRNYLNNNQFIETTTFRSVYFAKSIYHTLLNKAFNFSTTPTLNDTSTYQNIYDNLVSQTRLDLFGSSLYECSSCPINSKKCYSPESLPSYSSISSAFNINNQDLTQQISYYAKSYECNPGFIYDIKLSRCKFCPNNWTNCQAYKRINIIFSEDKDSNDAFSVSSTTEFLELVTELESGSLSYYLNEFAVEKIEIYLTFPSESTFELSYSSANASLASVLKTRIPSLSSYSLIFQPINYEENPNNFAYIYWSVKWIFSGFDNIYFKNIVFYVYPANFNLILRFSPGIFINQDEFSIFELRNCKILRSPTNGLYLIDGSLMGQNLNAEILYDIFFLNIENPVKFVIYNLTWNLHLNFIENDDNTYFAPIELIANTILIENFYMENLILSLKNKDFFLIQCDTNSLVTIKNITIMNITHYSGGFFYITAANVLIKEIFINNSTFMNSYLIYGPSFSIYNALILNSTFYGSVDASQKIYFVSTTFSILMNNISIINSNLRSFCLLEYQENFMNCSLSNFVFKGNTIYYNYEDYYFSAFVSFSRKLNDLILDRFSFLENNLVSTSNYAKAFYFYLESGETISILNFVFINNPNISAFYLSSFEDIYVQNFEMSNDVIDLFSYQNGFYLNQVIKNIEIINSTFKNLRTNNGLIYVENSSPDERNGSIFIQSLFSINIIYEENFAVVGAGFFLYSKKNWDIRINNASFFNSILKDESDYQGSSISISLDSIYSSLIIENSCFFNLTSNSINGVLFANLNRINIKLCLFKYANFYTEKNISFSYISSILSEGSFLNLRASHIFIFNSTFMKSYGMNGGAIYIHSISKICNITILKCDFNEIYSKFYGAVIYYSKSLDKKSTFFITNCNFKYVLSLKSGAILYAMARKNNFIFFNNCKISNFDSNDGSFIFSEFSHISLNNCSISTNFDWFNHLEVFNFFHLNKDLNFNSTTFIATIISIRHCSIFIENTIIFNINSSFLSPTILSLAENSRLYSQNSSFFNISFMDSCFYFESSEIIITSSNFFNASSSMFLNLFSDPSYDSKGFIFISYSHLSFIQNSVSHILCSHCNQGSLITSSYSTLYISETLIKENYGFNKGVIYIFSNTAEISNSSFINNNVNIDGGSLYLSSSNVSIDSSFFINNSASKGLGGAIFYKTTIKTVNLYLSDTIFQNNYASIGGAIYYQTMKIQIDSSTIFRNNTAKYYGSTFFSYPTYLRIIDEYNSTITYLDKTYEINDFRSGATLPKIIVQMYDENDDIVIPTNLSTNFSISLSIIPKFYNSSYVYQITRTSFPISENGSFIIEDLALISKPNDTVSVVVTSPDIYISESEIFNQNYNFSFYVNLRTCITGEIFSFGICMPCDAGQFSFNVEDESCNNCLNGLNCSSTTTSVISGYWRNSNYSLFIVPCYNGKDACVGGNSSGNAICQEGHIGARCESCDLLGKYWGKVYARGSLNSCVICDSMVFNYVILVLLAILNFVSMAFSIIGVLKNIQLSLQLKVIGILSRYSMLRVFNNQSSIYIKIYLAYFQILGVIATFKLTYPGWFSTFSTNIGNPTKASLFSTDCLIQHFGDIIPYIYFQLIIALLLPFLYFFIFSVGYVFFMFKYSFHRKYSILYTACLFTLIYFQPAIIQGTVSVLSCTSIGDREYIQADVSYLCKTPEYWFYSFIIGIPSLLLWAIIVPGIILWRLVKNRKILNEIRMKVRYGYIYEEYRIFYWEFVKMYEKILVTLFLQFYEDDILIKGQLILITVTIYLILVSKFKPYKTITLTKVDQFSSSILCTTILLALLSYENNFDYLVKLCYFIIVIINLFYNVFMIIQIVRTYSTIFETFSRKLKQRYPILSGFRKPLNTLNKWRTVRKAVAKYLRERERRNLDPNDEINERKMQLSVRDYDPERVGVNKSIVKSRNKIVSSLLIEFGDDSPQKKIKTYGLKEKKFFNISEIDNIALTTNEKK